MKCVEVHMNGGLTAESLNVVFVQLVICSMDSFVDGWTGADICYEVNQCTKMTIFGVVCTYLLNNKYICVFSLL